MQAIISCRHTQRSPRFKFHPAFPPSPSFSPTQIHPFPPQRWQRVTSLHFRSQRRVKKNLLSIFQSDSMGIWMSKGKGKELAKHNFLSGAYVKLWLIMFSGLCEIVLQTKCLATVPACIVTQQSRRVHNYCLRMQCVWRELMFAPQFSFCHLSLSTKLIMLLRKDYS